MNRWTALLATLLMTALVALSCSSGGGNPTAPAANPDLTGSVSHVGQAQTHLWGYYDVYVDVENQSVEAVLNRMCMFTANVTTFVNNPVTNLSFDIYGTPVTADYVDVDIDVTIMHPFPGMTEYNGYDVKGVFMGTGIGTMKYSSKLKYAEYGTDQALFDFNDKASLAYTDPYGDNLVGMPDGYTRWFNAKEFTFPGIMGYTPGKLATPAYTAMLTATLNGYKYFADGLGADEDLWTWLNANADTNGVFAAGASNTRNYYLRFPTAGGVKYGYAVVASWIDETTHPANAPEAAACMIDITPSIYYVDETDKGGDLILDINLWGWDYQPILIKIESTVLSAVHTLDAAEMTPTGGDANYSTYHAEIPADALTGTEGNEYWVIAEYADFDYTCDATPPGGAPVAKLAAFFRYDLFVANEPYNAPPVCDLIVVTSMPVGGWVPVPVEFDASGSYDPDPGDIIAFAWDFDGDDAYGESPDDDYTGTDDKPTHVYSANYNGPVNVKVTDLMDAEAICTTNDVDVTIKTTCGTMSMPANPSQTFIGSARLYAYNPEGTRAANPSYVIGSPNGSTAYFAAIDPNSTGMYFVSMNSPGYSINTMCMTSTDKIYYNDSGSSNTLYSMDYSNSSGFTNIRTAFSGGVIPGGSIWRHVVDENDYPIVLASNWMVYHWNGSSWGSGITVSSTIQSAAGSYSLVWDFDYDPTTGYYLFIERNGAYGIYAMKSDGSVAWSDTDIWSGAAPINWNVGVEVAQNNAECRIFAACGNQNVGGGAFYMARYNPMGGEKATGTITQAVPYGNVFNLGDGRGTLCKIAQSSNAWRFYCCTYGGNVWGYATMPSGW